MSMKRYDVCNIYNIHVANGNTGRLFCLRSSISLLDAPGKREQAKSMRKYFRIIITEWGTFDSRRMTYLEDHLRCASKYQIRMKSNNIQRVWVGRLPDYKTIQCLVRKEMNRKIYLLFCM